MYLLVTRSEKYMVRAKVCHDIRGTEKGLQEKEPSTTHTGGSGSVNLGTLFNDHGRSKPTKASTGRRSSALVRFDGCALLNSERSATLDVDLSSENNVICFLPGRVGGDIAAYGLAIDVVRNHARVSEDRERSHPQAMTCSG